MNEKKSVILTLLGEVHKLCKKNGIVYYLAETEKTAYSATLTMDAQAIRKFIDSYEGDTEHRALEHRGNNHSLSDNNLKYIDLDTTYITEGRIIRDIHLGMYIKIKPAGDSKSVWTKLERFRKHTGFETSVKRSALINSLSGAIYKDAIRKSNGKITAKSVKEIEIAGTPVYVKKDSPFIEDPEGCFDKLIVEKNNTEFFVCDAELSYRDIDLDSSRKRLAIYYRKLRVPKIKFKRSDAEQNLATAVSGASFARFCVATDLLQKYTYEEIIEHADDEDVRAALNEYISKATKLRSKKLSAYIGDEFTEVINKLYPEIDTDDLYKYTPEVYLEGIKVTDYNGNLIGIYGGKK